MRDFKKCDITYLLRKIDLEMLPHLKIASGSFIYYVINVYVPRVRANAYHMLTTPPRVFRDPKMCLRNIWTAPIFLLLRQWMETTRFGANQEDKARGRSSKLY